MVAIGSCIGQHFPELNLVAFQIPYPGKFAEVESLRHQLSSELRRISEELETKKERVRQGTLKEI